MTARDQHRRAVYSAEAILCRMLDNCAASGNPLVTIDDVALTLPPEARFGSIEDVQRYVDRVLGSGPVRTSFGQRPPVHVRARRSGKSKAHYEPQTAVVAIPDTGSAKTMLRELVVLHELAHHLDDGADAAAHGGSFLNTYLELIELVMAPQVALALRLLLAHHNIHPGAPVAAR